MSEASAGQQAPQVEQRKPQIKTLVHEVVKFLVDEPDQVEVDEFQERNETVLELRVAPGDIGKVIGRQGRTARALRALVDAAAIKANARYILDIVEDDDEEGDFEDGDSDGGSGDSNSEVDGNR
jgi:predicted RNA-binding protein YlqC (UPF0109 family)